MRLMAIVTEHSPTDYVVVETSDSETLHRYLCEHTPTDYSVLFTDYVCKSDLQQMARETDAEIADLKYQFRYAIQDKDNAIADTAKVFTWFATHNSEQQYSDMYKPLADASSKIQAIKLFREVFGTSLLTAKRVVEAAFPDLR